jgi:ADP-ribose pyrophosphatase YjhB (NUDIX family)
MISNRELYPLISVDIALFSVVEETLKVLLVKRAREPEAKKWALPGGVLKPDLDLSLEATARRVLADKVAVELPHLEEVATYSGPDRDPRGWSIAVLFYALLPHDQVNALVRSKVEALSWENALSPENPLAFDHSAQLQAALEILRDKVVSHALPLHLMPEKFTLTALQRTCEAILGGPIDKSVFRRRIKGSPDLIELDEFVRGAQRPAHLYRASEEFKF